MLVSLYIFFLSRRFKGTPLGFSRSTLTENGQEKGRTRKEQWSENTGQTLDD